MSLIDAYKHGEEKYFKWAVMLEECRDERILDQLYRLHLKLGMLQVQIEKKYPNSMIYKGEIIPILGCDEEITVSEECIEALNPLFSERDKYSDKLSKADDNVDIFVLSAKTELARRKVFDKIQEFYPQLNYAIYNIKDFPRIKITAKATLQ